MQLVFVHFFGNIPPQSYRDSLIRAFSRIVFLLVTGILAVQFAAGQTAIDTRGLPFPTHYRRGHILGPDHWYRVGGDTFYFSGPRESVKRKIADVDLNGVYFSDPDNGIAVGDRGTILVTSDSGTTWKQEDSDTKEELYDVTCRGPSSCWAVGRYGVIVHRDADSRWKLHFSGTKSNLHTIFFLDAENGWAAGYGCVVVATSDAGRTWNPINVDSTSTYTIKAVFFTSRTEGWAAYTVGLGRSGDGGRTWDFHMTEYGNFVGLTKDDKGRIIAIGGETRNYIADDFSAEWRLIPKPRN